MQHKASIDVSNILSLSHWQVDILACGAIIDANLLISIIGSLIMWPLT